MTQRMITMPIMLPRGRLAYLVIPFPLSKEDAALLAWQVGNTLKLIRRLSDERERAEAESQASIPPVGAD